MNEWEWQLLEDKTLLDHVEVDGVRVATGDRVRLKPRAGGDVLDLALQGQVALVEAIEQDYEGKAHLAVVLDADPGRDLGMQRQPGHRFFFDPQEVETLPAEQQGEDRAVELQRRILIAGIGNIFLGDDGFGVEVARRLAGTSLPGGVRVEDFGIRGFDLAYALQDGYGMTILIDAYPHGEAPGTVYVLEPDLSDEALAAPQGGFVEPHGMNPMNVLRMARAMHGPLKQVLIVGCEPETFGGEEGKMGLSERIEAAVDEAVRVTSTLVKRILDGDSVAHSGIAV